MRTRLQPPLAAAAAMLAVCALSGCAAAFRAHPHAHARRDVAPRVRLPVSRSARGRVSSTLITHGARSGREVALTFDADMTRWMLRYVRAGRRSIGYDPRIVSELRAARVPATIFMTGLWPEAHPAAARRLARDPEFEIENHTFDHSAFAEPCYGLPAVPTTAAKQAEVASTARVLERLTGRVPRYLRFPGGCHHGADLRLAAALGERPVQWDVISGDAYLRDPAAVARQTLAGVRPGSIVVMHLVGAPTAPATAAALRTILPALRRRGLRPVTLARLLAEPPRRHAGRAAAPARARSPRALRAR